MNGKIAIAALALSMGCAAAPAHADDFGGRGFRAGAGAPLAAGAIVGMALAAAPLAPERFAPAPGAPYAAQLAHCVPAYAAAPVFYAPAPVCYALAPVYFGPPLFMGYGHFRRGR